MEMLEFNRSFERLLLLTGRGLLGLYFIVPGISKITGFTQTSEYMAAHDVPLIPVLLVLTIAIQVGGGLALMFGFRAQLVAFVLAGLTLLISVFMHNFWVMPEGLERNHELQNFIKNLAIMAGLLYVAGAPMQRQKEKSGAT
jgi:putative oxidoreductase